MSLKSLSIFARSLFVAAGLFTISLSATAQEEPADDVVRVSTNLVTVPISVLDHNGRFIPGLTQEQFRLFENGIAQNIAYFDSADKPFTVALLLDVSDSTKFKLKEIQDAAIAFTEQLRPEDRVIVMAFDSRVNIVTEATSDREVLQTAIRGIKSGGGTSLYSAVKVVISERLNRIRGRKAIVLFSDGVDTTSRNAAYEETLHTAQKLDALIYTIQYNTYSDLMASNDGTELMTPKGEPLKVAYDRAKRYLNLLAEKSGGRPFFADNVERLKATFERIAQELRQQYSIGFYPRHDAGDSGTRQIKVTIDQTGVVVRTRRSYVFKAPPAP